MSPNHVNLSALVPWMSPNPINSHAKPVNFYAFGPCVSPNPKRIIRFVATYVTKLYKFICVGAMDVAKPYKFICFGAMDVTKPYKIYVLWCHGCHQALSIYTLWCHGCHQTIQIHNAMDVTKPYTFIGLKTWMSPNPLTFASFGATDHQIL